MSAEIPFTKGHALGNDYVVVDAADLASVPTAAWVRALCDRHRGVGADGLLLADAGAEPVGLRIFNPDGTEAEKSGNGLRILAAYLHGRGLVAGEPFEVALAAERVSMRVEGDAGAGAVLVAVDMGRASFRADDVGFRTDARGVTAVPGGGGEAGEVGPQRLELPDGDAVAVRPVSMGNPHCVVFVHELRRDEFLRVAPRIAVHDAFRAGTNVQFARVVGDAALEAWVWERGAAETLASGSSACAVAAAALRDERVAARELDVRMRGGTLEVAVDDAGALRLRGPAQIVCRGELRAGVAAGWTRDDGGAGER